MSTPFSHLASYFENGISTSSLQGLDAESRTLPIGLSCSTTLCRKDTASSRNTCMAWMLEVSMGSHSPRTCRQVCAKATVPRTAIWARVRGSLRWVRWSVVECAGQDRWMRA
jgi:hypothetical protein